METAELLKHLDLTIEGEVTAEAFDAAFGKKYIPKLAHDEYRNQMGGAFGAVDAETKTLATKFLGAEEAGKIKWKNEDETPRKSSDILREIGQKIYEAHDKKVKEAMNPDAEVKLKGVMDDLEKERKLREDKDTELMELRKTEEEKEQTYAQRLATVELNHHVDALYENLPYSDQADKYWRKGFRDDMDKKYKKELRDGKLAIFDSNGEPVKNKQKTANLNPDEVLDMELETAGKKKLNNVKRDERYVAPRADDAKPRKGLRDVSQTLAAMKDQA